MDAYGAVAVGRVEVISSSSRTTFPVADQKQSGVCDAAGGEEEEEEVGTADAVR